MVLEGDFYVFILKKALDKGKPEIFNTDQGSQFTSNDFIKMLSEIVLGLVLDEDILLINSVNKFRDTE